MKSQLELILEKAVSLSCQDFETAKRIIDQAAEENPNNADCYWGLGTIFLRTGDSKNASIAFSQALSLNGKHQASLMALAICRFAQSEYELAHGLLERLATIGVPDNKMDVFLFYRGRVNLALGKTSEALRNFDAVIGSKEQFYQKPSHFFRGIIHFELGDLDSSLTDFKVCVEDFRCQINAQLWISDIFFQQGEYNESYVFALKSVGENTSCAHAYFQAGRALYALGKRRQALEYFGKTLLLDNSLEEIVVSTAKAIAKENAQL